MPHVSEQEQKSKTASEAGWATIGRGIADAAMRGKDPGRLIVEAAVRRQQEQNAADKATQFAALARQIGDAHHQHRDLAPLIHQILELRRQEIGPALHSEPPLSSC